MGRRFGRLLLAACALAFVSPGFAWAAPADAQAEAAPHPRAVEITLLVIPKDLMEEVGVRGAKRGFFLAVETDPKAQEMERNYPGLWVAIWSAVEPELHTYMADEHPRFVNMVASLYSSRFTPAELDALYRFYTTPTGRKAIAQMRRGMIPDAMVAEAVRTGTISEASLQTEMTSRTKTAVDALTAADEPAIRTAMRAVPITKIEDLNKDLMQAMLQWANQPRPQLDARLQELMAPVVERYLREHPAKH
jgi:hypothetical protein